MALNKNSEIFVIYIAGLEAPTTMFIYLLRIFLVQNSESTLATLQWNKIPFKIPAKYSDYADIFSTDLTMELLDNTGMNEYIIKLIEKKQPFYGPIYALKPIELETLKAYIKTHLKTRFIRSSKILIGAFILFDNKSDDNLCLYVNYQGLNNLTIKN